MRDERREMASYVLFLDLQAFLRSGRKVKVWLVLGMSLWSEVYLQARFTTWIRLEER